MSHLKERPEKKCLNCNADIHGRYCHVCGQENLVPEESAWYLVTHFFNDITHFDGKFFSTLKYVIFKPGFLSSEYKVGRRASYLNPVRMYIFTSAVFFLVFFSITDFSDNPAKKIYSKKSMEEILKMDSLEFLDFTRDINNGKPMSKETFKQYTDSIDQYVGGLQFSVDEYKDKAAYDSVLRTGKVDDNWFERLMTYKEIEMKERYHNDRQMMSRAFVKNLVHIFPQMLFISLPLFALMLQLLYFRRKHFYYVSHAIFAIHFYIFIFIMLFVIVLLRKLNIYLEWGLINYVNLLVILLIFYYLYRAMLQFYRQGWVKTLIKFLFLNIFMLCIICLLFIVFIFYSLMKT